MSDNLIKEFSGAESAREYVKRLRDNSGGTKPFFRILNGREPIGREHETLNNLVNRGSYSAEFVALIMKKFDLEDVTLGEFYGGGFTRNEDL